MENSQAGINKEYFATRKLDELCADLIKKIDGYYKYLQTSGRMTLWRRSYEFYYRGLFRGGKMNRAGNEGEYQVININHYRNILQHLKNMTTQQLPALTPQAANTDYKSMAQTIVASGILDYYLNEKSMANYADVATENCLVFGESYVVQEWDPTKGEDYGADQDTGKIYKTGDIVLRNYTPMDVIKDFVQPDPYHDQWYIVREYVNKYDLASKYETKQDIILATALDDTRLRDQRVGLMTMKESDLIPLYKFYHVACPALPNGRYVEFLSSDDYLFDGPLPYDDLPIYRMAAEEQMGSCFGYSIGFDLMPIQEAIDGLYSTIVTNQSNYGVQNICVPTGSGISVQQLAGGLNLIQYDPKAGKPEGMNLTNTPPEIFKFLEMLEHVLETISGVNSVTRGNPEASLKSGAALALVQSMAIQFNSGLQKSYAKLWSMLGTGTIKLLKNFPQTKRNITIAGKNNRSYMAEFTKDDLTSVNRVTVDLGNPLSRTTAGKVDMADNLLQRGMIKEPEQYIEVLTTGKLEPVFQGPQAEKMLIRAENEKLMEGTAVVAVATDQHNLHIQEHKTVIASPEARESNAVAVTVKHIEDHINLLRTVDPALLIVLGQQPVAPLPPPQMPGAPMDLPAPGQAGMQKPEGGGNPAESMIPQSPLQQEAAKVNGPSMPKNPLTGDKFNTNTGGLR